MIRGQSRKWVSIFLASVMSLFVIQSAIAAGPVLNTFGGTKSEYFYGLTPTQDGGYVAVGYTFSNDGDMADAEIHGDKDALLVKYDSDNQVEFISYYGGSKDDCFYDVIADVNGWLTVVGVSNSDDQDLDGMAHGGLDGIVVQYDDKGDYQADLAVGNAGDDILNTIVESDASYLVGGYSELDQSGNPAAKTATIHEVDLDLTSATSYTYGGSKADNFIRLLKMEEVEGALAVGTMTSNDGDFARQLSGASDGIAMKVDSLGEIEWKYWYNGPGMEGFWNATATSDGGYLLAGVSAPSNNKLSGLLVKLSENGKLQWSKTYPIAQDVQFQDVVESNDGNYLVSGYLVNDKSNQDGLLLKVDKKGNVVASRTFGGSKDEIFWSMVQLADNNYATVGGVGTESEGYDALAMAFDDSVLNVPVQAVKVSKTAATLKPNQTLQLTAVVTPSSASNKAVQWSSSNSKIATVDRYGKVRALKVGTATITAKSIEGGKTATCIITIKK